MTSKTAGSASAAFDRVMSFGEKVLDSPAAVGKLVEAIHTTADAVRVIATSTIERERIRADAAQAVERIHSVRDVLLTYLDRSFDERRENFSRLFDTLDKALEAGQLDAVAKTLDAVVALAAESPFKALADAATASKILKDKGHDWEL
jgi:hypothetical protein